MRKLFPKYLRSCFTLAKTSVNTGHSWSTHEQSQQVIFSYFKICYTNWKKDYYLQDDFSRMSSEKISKFLQLPFNTQGIGVEINLQILVCLSYGFMIPQPRTWSVWGTLDSSLVALPGFECLGLIAYWLPIHSQLDRSWLPCDFAGFTLGFHWLLVQLSPTSLPGNQHALHLVAT